MLHLTILICSIMRSIKQFMAKEICNDSFLMIEKNILLKSILYICKNLCVASCILNQTMLLFWIYLTLNTQFDLSIFWFTGKLLYFYAWWFSKFLISFLITFFYCLEYIRLLIAFLCIFSLYILLLILATDITFFVKILFADVLALALPFKSTIVLIFVSTNSWISWMPPYFFTDYHFYSLN